MPEAFEDCVTTRLWRHGELAAEGFALSDVSEHLAEDDALVWVDLCRPDHELLRKLAVELDLDTHAVEDAILLHERPKATLHASHTFLTVYGTALREADLDDPRHSRLELTRISAFVLPRGIVTVHGQTGFDMAAVERRWEEDHELLQYGVGALVHGLLDSIVDGHFETIQQLDQMIEGLEDVLFDEHGSSRQVQTRTYRIRKELVELRRAVLPMREVVNAVMRHRTEATHHRSELDGYFADLYDHVLRASEWTESLRDMVTTVFETNLSLQDARLNTVMKKLTGWAAIIAVPTAVTGWFGMNVPYPGFGSATGVVASAGIILGLGLLLFVLFKRKDWI
ncbi:MAG: magnesium transporter CorA family protein [Intrasporangium sp.]|uniref:magnesium transporter CorA family protein n=1 Tax=Intrasporangium sp. TaxID=1925024 RepID=UPI0026486137|nr:magnesium transporter CorA family protein [Intrasporangium sp.]MDN5798206.1 magnesium transporter CorA family protein [Intrasporangium sp.]